MSGMDFRMVEYRDASGAQRYRPTTASERLTLEYQANGEPFQVIHREVHSTRPIAFEIVDPRPLVAPVQATARCLTRELSFFSYQKGQNIDLGLAGGATAPATAADTALSAASQTPNNDDLAIMALSFRVKGLRVQYSEAAITNAIAVSGGGSLSDQTMAALRGYAPIADPAAFWLPPQADSPFNLHRVFDAVLRPLLDLTFQWNGKVRVYQGLAVSMPAAAAVPHLHAAGQNRLDNCLGIPEGYLWRRAGSERDNELEVMVGVNRDGPAPCVAITPPQPLLGGTFELAPLPQRIILDVTLALHVVAFSTTSSNAG